MATYFASLERDTREACIELAAHWNSQPHYQEMLDVLPNPAIVLNEARQIVSVNKTFLAAFHTTLEEVQSYRPGEAMGCVFSREGEGGCGTGPHCVVCGAVRAVVECREKNEKVIQECRVLVGNQSGATSLDLRVVASPFQLNGITYTLVIAEDISSEKRSEVLQNTFFHDISNTASCINGFIFTLSQRGVGNNSMVYEKLNRLSEQLVEEINAQRDLIAAEKGILQIELQEENTDQVVQDIVEAWTNYATSTGRILETTTVESSSFKTDIRLLKRILGNMVKNAVEATYRGEVVRIECRVDQNSIVFAVHNREFIPENVQMQIFQRSFSTKSKFGRGIGTRSMKLLGERYLGGKVDFTSTPENGTTFRIVLPKNEVKHASTG